MKNLTWFLLQISLNVDWIYAPIFYWRHWNDLLSVAIFSKLVSLQNVIGILDYNYMCVRCNHISFNDKMYQNECQYMYQSHTYACEELLLCLRMYSLFYLDPVAQQC